MPLLHDKADKLSIVAAMMTLITSMFPAKNTIRRGPFAHPPPTLERLWDRILWGENDVSICAWPSRGGFIMLERATALDFDFLGLDPVRIVVFRDPDQDREDEFSQRLLRLGAKWFDSHDRYGFVWDVAACDEYKLLLIDRRELAPPTAMERRWVSVGIPSSGVGFWLAESETAIRGNESRKTPPENAPQVSLARTMDEKCEILQSLGAKFYEDVEQYHGVACVNAWKTRFTGEVGPLELSRPTHFVRG